MRPGFVYTRTSTRTEHPDGSVTETAGEWSERPADEPQPAGEFSLVRDVDESGVSGVGRVAQGFVFDDGTVALRWLTAYRSMAVYASVADVDAIHGHNGSTRIEWVTPAATPVDLREARFHDAVREVFEAPGEVGPAQGDYAGDIDHFVDMLEKALRAKIAEGET